ncbi:RING-type E3 ubiquitin transferase [Heracleum sosnowskyi]|uniref:RING-type E3 ubiquitin transferase n=1 Tax=Heracleum sosnowskyi TaxID=360622 RepID=A0AAD8M0R3_9APIA|nr:RING-type E3 ubiquitin transferase [Heracleum sosnowskyi]
MEISNSKALLKNISCLLNLSCRANVSFEPVNRYYQKVEEILMVMKLVLDAIIDAQIASDESLQKAFTSLNDSVNDLKERFETWHPLMSKTHFVLQVEFLMTKVHSSSFGIFEFLKDSDQSLPVELSTASLKHWLQKLKQLGFEQTSALIKRTMRDIVDATGPNSDCLAKITDLLNLKSNQELLIEAVALENLKVNAEQAENKGEVNYLNQLLALVTFMHERLVLLKLSESYNTVQIPADVVCPLSLEIITDPVIVASGQTYERAFIRKWFELGLTVCPKTRQTLAHTDLLSNNIAKALIANWCESNGVKLPDPMKSTKLKLPSSLIEYATTGAPLDPRMFQLRNIQFAVPDSAQTLGCPEKCTFYSANNREGTSPSHPRSSSEDPFSVEAVNGHGLGMDSISLRSSEHMQANSGEKSSNMGAQLEFSSQIVTHVQKMVENLKSTSMEVKRDATAELRLLAKCNMDNRIVITNCGGIPLLVNLLRSTDTKTQENAVTTLLNLSINDDNKVAIVNADAIEPLIHVLESGTTEAKENSAATFFSLSVIKDNKVMIGKSRAIQPLVDLLGNGTLRGKTDAVTALFNLSKFPKNKAQIVQAGAVKYLVELMDPAAGMVDKAVVLLSNLATIPEGRTSIVEEGGIPILVEVVELGSARGKETAAAALLLLCTKSGKICKTVLQEGAVPPLVSLSQSGTPRAKAKAQALLSYFRDQLLTRNSTLKAKPILDAEEGKITISGTIDPPTLAKILRKIKKKSEFLLKPMDEPYCSNNQATYAQHSHCCRPRKCACTTTQESFAMGYPQWPGINIPSAPPPTHEYYQTTPPEMAYNHPIYQTFSDDNPHGCIVM